MKKALVFLLLLAVAGGLFAQFTIGGRVDAYWIPFQYVSETAGDETISMMGAGLGRDDGTGVGPRAQLLGKATTEDNTMGIRIDLQFRTAVNTWGFGDYVDAWWRPSDMFYLDVGKFVDNTFRGKVGDFWFRKFTVGSYGADAIFSRFNSGGQNIGPAGAVGLLGILTFGDLTVGLALPGLDQFTRSGNDDALVAYGISGDGNSYKVHEAADTDDGSGALVRAYEKVHVAVGYTIQDIGFVRVAYVGATPSFVNNAVTGPRIEAAFNLTAVEGLNLDFGAKYPLPLNEGSFKSYWNAADAVWEVPDPNPVDEATYQNPIQLALGAIYTITEEFTFNGRVDFNFMGGMKADGYEYKSGMELNAHIWPTYNLGFMTVGLDFGIVWQGKDKMVPDVGDEVEDDTTGGMMVGGGIFASKAWGSCTLQGGLAYSVATKIGQDTSVPPNDKKADGVFTIPVTFAWNF